MSVSSLPTLESWSDDGRALQLRFCAVGDRIGHELVVISREPHTPPLPVCLSQEGTDREVWPMSPPLQSVSVSEHAGQPVALLVGMAGRSHWSASFLMLPQGRMRVELACRVGGAPQQLGSGYRFDHHVWQLEQLPARPAGMRSLTSSRATLHWHAEQLTPTHHDSFFLPAPLPWERQPVGWSYEIALVSNAPAS